MDAKREMGPKSQGQKKSKAGRGIFKKRVVPTQSVFKETELCGETRGEHKDLGGQFKDRNPHPRVPAKPTVGERKIGGKSPLKNPTKKKGARKKLHYGWEPRLEGGTIFKTMNEGEKNQKKGLKEGGHGRSANGGEDARGKKEIRELIKGTATRNGFFLARSHVIWGQRNHRTKGKGVEKAARKSCPRPMFATAIIRKGDEKSTVGGVLQNQVF